MALVGLSLILQGQSWLREWLLFEPHGPYLPALALRHRCTDVMSTAGRVYRRGVPRVANRAIYRVGQGQYSMRPGPSMIGQGQYNEPRINNIGSESIILV